MAERKFSRRDVSKGALGAITAGLLAGSGAKADNGISLDPLRDLGEFVAIDKNGNDVSERSLARLLEERPATISFGYVGCGTDHREMHTMLSELKSKIHDLVYVVIDVDDPAIVGKNPMSVLPQTLKEMQDADMKGDIVVLYPKDPDFIAKLQNDRGDIAATDPRKVVTVGLYNRKGKEVELMDNGQPPSAESIVKASASMGQGK